MQSDFLSPIRSRRLSNYIKHLSGLVAYYPLDEVSGSTAYNKAPTTQGTFNGTITGATVGQAGKVGRAYSFDGTGDYITTGFSVKNQSLITFGAIINFADTAGNKRIYYESPAGDTTTTRFGININSAEKVDIGIRTGLPADPIVGCVSDAAIGAGAYHLLVVDIDLPNDTAHMYLDGVAFAFTIIGGAFASIDSSFANTSPAISVIGSRQGGTDSFNGKIQHLFMLGGQLLNGSQVLKLARIAGLA